jgi:20S proteasome subunit beta 1
VPTRARLPAPTSQTGCRTRSPTCTIRSASVSLASSCVSCISRQQQSLADLRSRWDLPGVVCVQVYVCRSGSAADTQAIADILRLYLDMHSLESGKPPEIPVAANILNGLCYGYKNQLMAGMICAGYDERNGGVVYSIPLGGGLFREAYTIGGSGSGYIYGYCDANFKKGMSKQEAQEFVKNAVSLAMWRDGSSGGVIRTVTISKDGVEREMVQGDALPKLHAKWCP